MELTSRDRERLQGVHPDLFKVVFAAAARATVSFMVIEGVRTLAKQKEYFAAGKSRTMRSRHLDGHAVDLCPLVDLDGDGDKELSWNSADFIPLAEGMKEAASKLGVPIEWGGDWFSFHDAPHFQLPWAAYPGLGSK